MISDKTEIIILRRRIRLRIRKRHPTLIIHHPHHSRPLRRRKTDPMISHSDRLHDTSGIKGSDRMRKMVQASVPEIGSFALFSPEWRCKAEGRGGDPESRGSDCRGVGSPIPIPLEGISRTMYRDEDREREAAAITEKVAVGGGECWV